jgi:Fe-S-cluster containining protein
MLPWYEEEKLKFECTGCGKCCSGKAGFVWITEEEGADMAKLLNLSLSDFKKRYIRIRDKKWALAERKNLDCIFLEGKKCKVYAARPEQCKTYPFWPENLNSQESWNLAALECEGINRSKGVIDGSQSEGENGSRHRLD